MWTGHETFTREQFLKVAELMEPGERAPVAALLMAELGTVTPADVNWARQVADERRLAALLAKGKYECDCPTCETGRTREVRREG